MPLDNPAEWVKLYQNHYIALPIQNESNKYEPISDFIIPVVCDKPVIAVLVNSITAKKTWNLGARLSFAINIQNLEFGNILQIGYQKILLKRTRLIYVNNANQPYSIFVNVPYWLQDVSIKIWEYTGIIEDLIEVSRFKEISQKLDRIESKLDFTLIPVNNYSTQFDNPNSSTFLGII